MSDKVKKSSNDKKVVPALLIKGSSKNNNIFSVKNGVGGITSKKDNFTVSQKNKKPLSINILSTAHRISDKAKAKKKNEDEISFHFSFKKGKFLNEPKILNNFLSFFNIRELFIIMEIDEHIFQAITTSDVFKKYLSLRKDFILKDKNNKKINQLISKNTKSTNININNNNRQKIKSTSRKYYEKYDNENIVSPVTLGFNGVLVVYPTKAGEKERLEKELNDEKKEDEDYYEDNENKKKLELNLPSLDFSKLGISHLINNNCQNIKKYIKSLSLTNFQSHCIFNGILEYLIMMENGIPTEKVDSKIFSLENSRALNGLSYYTECLINLDYPNIIKLNLSNVGINSTQIMKKLCYIFHKYYNSLRVLNLSHNAIDDKCAKLLFPGLQSSNILEILNISNNNIGNEGLKFAENFFSSNNSLQTLIFDHNLIGPIGGDCLFKHFKSNPYLNLKALDIGYNGITREGTEGLISFIKNNDKLITFNIGGNYFCDEGIEEICESFVQKNNKNILSYLDFQNNNITKIGCEFVYNMLSDSPFINGISLKNNTIKNEGVIKIFYSLTSENSKLICLDLSNTKCDEKALKFISEKISKNIILQKLNLSNNSFRKGGGYIKNLLIQKSNLKHLNLSYCEINIQFNMIFEGLAKNKCLKTVDFSGNSIPMKHELLKELQNALSINHYLINLILDDCNIDDIGMSFISKGLENNHMLKSFSLTNNYITLKSIPALINAIEKSKIIKKIYLDENNGLNYKYINEIDKILNLNENNFIPINNDIN